MYDVGEIDGVHYLTMAYIEGKRLSEFIKAEGLPTPKQTATVLGEVAGALGAWIAK